MKKKKRGAGEAKDDEEGEENLSSSMGTLPLQLTDLVCQYDALIPMRNVREESH